MFVDSTILTNCPQSMEGIEHMKEPDRVDLNSEFIKLYMQNVGRLFRILKVTFSPCGGFAGVLSKCSKFAIPIKRYFTLSVVQRHPIGSGCTGMHPDLEEGT